MSHRGRPGGLARPVGPEAGGGRRAIDCLRAVAATVLLSSSVFAVPSPDGLTGVIRMPSANVALGSTTFHRASGFGASFTYPVMSGLEAGVTRVNGDFGLHGKIQLLPETLATPAIAAGVQDWTKTNGPRRYFWTASKRLESLGAGLHAGARSTQGFFDGPRDYFAGAEYDVSMVRLKGEYDWGSRAGSAGLEIQLGSHLTVYDFGLDLFGAGRNASNLIGISFQGQF